MGRGAGADPAGCRGQMTVGKTSPVTRQTPRPNAVRRGQRIPCRRRGHVGLASGRASGGAGSLWRALIRFGFATAWVFCGLVFAATSASAHAVVVSSQPGDREQLAAPPTEVTVRFSEPVSMDLGGLTVLNSFGDRVDSGGTNQPRADTLRTGLVEGLGDGTYVTNYRVVSSDGHPVSGAVVFSVGAPVDEPGASRVKEGTRPGLEVLGAIGRFLAYAGGLGAAGAGFFAWFLHDQAPDRKRLDRPVIVAAAAGFGGQLVMVGAHAALASGSGLTAMFDPSVIPRVLGGSPGWSSVTFAVGLVACAASMKAHNTTVAQCLSFYGLVAVALSYALWGHEPPEKLLNFVGVTLHAASAAVWFGGLAGLLAVLRWRSGAAVGVSPDTAGTRPDALVSRALMGDVEGAGARDRRVGPGPEAAASLTDTVGIVIRFSTAATISVVLVGLAGVGMAGLELGSPGAVLSTTYGRALIAKLALVAAVAAVAAYNHFRLVPVVLGERDGRGRPDGNDETERADRIDRASRVGTGEEIADDGSSEQPDLGLYEWRRLKTAVWFEVIAVIAVLGATAILVGLTPGRISNPDALAGPFSATKPVGAGKVELIVSPARAGANTIHITYLTTDNRPAEIAQSVTVDMALPERGVGPLSRSATKAGVGHFVVQSTPDMSIAGAWKVTLVSRLGEFDQQRIDFSVPIAP